MHDTNIFEDYTIFYLTPYESYDVKKDVEEEIYIDIPPGNNKESIYKHVRSIIYISIIVLILTTIALLSCTCLSTRKTCYSDWVEYSNRCYYTSMSFVSWEDASSACNKMKASLLWATSKDHEFLKSYDGDCFWTNIKINHKNMTSLGSASTDHISILVSVYVTHMTCTCYDNGIKVMDCNALKAYVCYISKK